jgi:hypothetical protein
MDERTLARFLSKIAKNGPVPPKRPDLGPCWIWKPVPSNGGYGQFYLEGKPQLAHRASYKLFVGPIPSGLTIDHLCGVRACVRRDHLEAVPLAENLRRARVWEAGAAFQRGKTHCPQGHPYDEENTRVGKNGRRSCKACARRQISERRARERAENPPQPQPPKTHCKNGHAFAEWGYTEAGGKRACRLCSRQRTREYQERQRALAGPQPEKLTCKSGHPWTPGNIYVNPRGQRSCRACHNEKSQERYRALKAKREARARPPRETCSNGHAWSGDNLYIMPDGTEKCRECARGRNQRYEARRKAARPLVAPKPPRTHCGNGHELAGDNLYVAPNGRKFCRQCTAIYQGRQRNGTAPRNPNKGAWQRAKTHCPAGHEYTPENTYDQPGGGRQCRECLRTRSREHMRQKRAAARTGETEQGALF